MLALTGVLAKSLFKDAATIAAARKGRSAEPEPESPGEAKPDMLVALHPTSVTTEEGPDPDEPRTQTPVPSRQAEEPEAEPPLLEVAAKTTPEPESEPDSKRLLKEPTPEVSKDAWRAASPEVPKDAWREISPREDTEVLVESCQIRLWRGYFSYQLYAASGSGDVDRALALSPYFRVKDPQAPGAAATAALREVLDQLEAEGWTVASEGQRWYSFELERPL
jgi:hypothetical protein